MALRSCTYVYVCIAFENLCVDLHACEIDIVCFSLIAVYIIMVDPGGGCWYIMSHKVVSLVALYLCVCKNLTSRQLVVGVVTCVYFRIAM